MKEELIKNLKELPLNIETKETELIVRKNDLDSIKNSLTNYEWQVKNAVLGESKENKELSNESKRASEIKRRLSEATTYKTLISEQLEALIIFEKLKIRIKRLKRDFRSCESISRLGL